jgi:hypothetical protein
MPLQRIKGALLRESYGFAFPMRVAGCSRTIRVFVADEAITVEDRTAADEEVQAEFQNHMSSFESLAGEKYDLGRVTSDGVVLITADDLCDLLG